MYIGPSYLGRRTKGDIVIWKFTLTVADVPTTLASTPAVKCYQDGSNVEFTGGITLTPDYDGKTGLCELIVDTSNAAYSAGHFYDFFISAGAIGIVSPVGYVVGHFELIPEPSDLRMVNGGSTGATAGKLELTQLSITVIGSDPAVSVIGDTGPVMVLQNATNFPVLWLQGGTPLYAQATGNGNAGAIIRGSEAGGAFNSPGGPGLILEGGNAGSSDGFFGGPGIFVIGGEGSDGSKRAGPAVVLLTDIEGGMTDAQSPEAAIEINKPGDWTNAFWAPGPVGIGTDAILIGTDSSGSGKAIRALGQLYIAPTHVDDDALVLTPNGTGLSINAPVEGSIGIIQSLMLANAANAGKTNGMETTTAHLRNIADTKNRITATVDAEGNRSVITLDLT